MKINFGAGNLLMEGYVNHDRIKHRKEIDVAFDLNEYPYPLGDDTYEEVRIFDVIEHLNEPIKTINEFHRILKKGGLLHMRVLGLKHPEPWIDPTHKRPFDINSFDFLDLTTRWGKEYGYYSDRHWTIMERSWDRNGNVRIKMTPIKEKDAYHI